MIGTKKQILGWVMDQPQDKFEVKVYKEKRSGLASRYFHRLTKLLADGEHKGFDQKKNELIARYGNREFVRGEDGKPEVVYRLDNEDYIHDPVLHLVPTRYAEDFHGVKLRAFLKLKGTHTYTSKEMAHLIDCTRDECLGCGIDEREIETFEEKHLMERLRGGKS